MDYGAGIRAEVGHQRADLGELAPSREALWQATAWGADVDPYGGPQSGTGCLDTLRSRYTLLNARLVIQMSGRKKTNATSELHEHFICKKSSWRWT
jgi:hypothetical protein